MNKLNIYAIFGIVFLSSMLLGSGMYSTNQVFAQNENEAEIEADIEQENKCKKDTECENENEINNKLNITTITGAANGDGDGNGTPEEECELCFTTEPDGPWPNGNQLDEFIADLEAGNISINGEVINSIQELCEYLASQGELVSYETIVELLSAGEPNGYLNINQAEEVADCLVDAGVITPPQNGEGQD